MSSAAGRHWQTLGPHVDRWLELGVEDRRRWLDELQAQDPTLAREVLEVDALYARLRSERFLDSGPPLSPAPLLAGTCLGPYTLETRLGYGGSSSVWRARHSDGRFGGPVALKLLNAFLIGTDAEGRFQREQQVLVQLRHPNIVRLLDRGTSNIGQPYLVLEYARGQPIDVYVNSRRLDAAARIELVLDVLTAVSYVHAQRLVHCDIKPANVFVTLEGQVKLLDFGIAQHPDLPAAGSPSQRKPLTSNYASPEQLQGGRIDGRSDVYSLGVLLCELLSGTRPNRDAAVTAAELLVGVDLRLQSVVLTALEPEPSARYASVAELAAGLRHWLRCA